MPSAKYYIYCSLFCALSMLQSGCSISYSLEKSSDSVSTSLDSITSISTSSSGGEENQVKETGTSMKRMLPLLQCYM